MKTTDPYKKIRALMTWEGLVRIEDKNYRQKYPKKLQLAFMNFSAEKRLELLGEAHLRIRKTFKKKRRKT